MPASYYILGLLTNLVLWLLDKIQFNSLLINVII